MASSSPHTLLAVGHTSEACHLASWIHSTQEDWFELETHEEGEEGYLSPSVEGKGGEWEQRWLLRLKPDHVRESTVWSWPKAQPGSLEVLISGVCEANKGM